MEIVIAGALVAVTLVPALRIMRDSMAISRQAQTRELLLVLSAGKMEEELALTSAQWTSGSSGGTFAADGFAQIRYTATRADDPLQSGKLMVVQVMVWDDANGNGAKDSGELSVALASKAAKILNYQKQADGG